MAEQKRLADLAAAEAKRRAEAAAAEAKRLAAIAAEEARKQAEAKRLADLAAAELARQKAMTAGPEEAYETMKAVVAPLYEEVASLNTQRQVLQAEMDKKAETHRAAGGQMWGSEGWYASREYARLYEERAPLIKKGKEILKAVQFNIRESFKVDPAEQAKPLPVNLRLGSKSTTLPAGAREIMQAAIDDLHTYIPKSVLPTGQSSILIVYEKNERAYYEDAARKVVLGGIDRTGQSDKVTFHELGHWLEYRGRSITPASTTSGHSQQSQNAQAFLAYRTQGETAEKLKKLTDQLGFRDDEVAKKDKFPDPYMGKIYTHRATELTSMTLQYLKEKPELLLADKELHNFLFCQLRGLKWEKPKGK